MRILIGGGPAGLSSADHLASSTSLPSPQRFPARGVQVGFFLLACLPAFLVRFSLDREPIDDAYITFRHAVRLWGGNGWGYNDGIPTIATTSPLWTLILAPLSAHLPDSGRLQSILLDSAVPGLLFLIALDLGLGLLGAAGVSLLYILSPDAALCAPTGMELPLFQLLFCLSVLSLQKGRMGVAACFAALLPITRPEGLLAVGLLSVAGFRLHRNPLRALLVLGPFLCWTLFTILRHEGGPIPNSLAGKLAAYPGRIDLIPERIGEWLDYWGSLGFKTLNQDPLHNLPRAFLFFSCVALAALFAVRSRNPAWTLPVYGILYCLSSLFLHVPLFSWYYCHPTPGICLGLIAGPLLALKKLTWLSSGARALAYVVLGVVILVLLGGSLLALGSWSDKENPPAWIGRILIPHERERAHEKLAEAIRQNLGSRTERTHPKILVHDLGMIGFLLPGACLVDVAGISTPRITDWLKRHPEEPPFRVSRALIESESPDYFVTLFEHGPATEDWPWIEERFECIGEFRGEAWAVPWAAAYAKRLHSPAAPEE